MIFSFLVFVLYFLTGFVVLTTVLPFAIHGHWIIRSCDFPRTQLAVIGAVLLLIVSVVYVQSEAIPTLWFVAMITALAACVCYQAARIFPFTRWHTQETTSISKRTSDFKDEISADAALGADKNLQKRRIRLMSSNVLQTNRDYSRLIKEVHKADPDVICLLETDQGWKDGISDLYERYPHTREYVTDNLYGMIVLSRMPIIRSAIRERVQEDIPSILIDVALDNGQEVRFYFVHPMPPSPSEAETSEARDLELILVGKEVDRLDKPVIVAGDLNDVAWSDTTQMFKKISGLLDPRVGRGFFNTFHAQIPLFRWPLDHVFHSHHFQLGCMKRLSKIGSDHFPIFIELYLADTKSQESDKKQDRTLTGREEEIKADRLVS